MNSVILFGRYVKDFIMLFLGFIYDFYRYVRHSGSYFRSGREKRNYRAVKAYHSIEKSLSFKNRKVGAGWQAAVDFVGYMKKHKPLNDNLVFHEKIGIGVVHKLINVSVEEGGEIRKDVSDFVGQFYAYESTGGVIENFEGELAKGKLNSPEDFFFSRYSVRDFMKQKLEMDIVLRALKLATKTPSVCNRESYYVYYTDKKNEIAKILGLQNGNRGFGDGIPGIVIVTADLGAFSSQIERYQHWIDGGMYAMSLVYAFHSLGVGVCCLNWSQSFLKDIKARRLLDINDSHNIIMLLAVGYPATNLRVCASPRGPIEDHFEVIG